MIKTWMIEHLKSLYVKTSLKKVKSNVIIDDSEIDEEAWQRATAHNSAFDFLNDPDEDVYTMNDGKPFVYDQD